MRCHGAAGSGGKLRVEARGARRGDAGRVRGDGGFRARDLAVAGWVLVLVVASGCGEEEVVTFPGPRTPTPASDERGSPSTPTPDARSERGGAASSAPSGAGSDVGPGCFDISGRWDGGFRSPTGLDGTAIVRLTQDGCAIGGDSVFTDAPCFSAADVRGTLFAGASPDEWIFEGELYGQTPQGGELLVEVAGPIRTGSRPLRGTFDYFVAAGGVCTGNNGVINIEQP